MVLFGGWRVKASSRRLPLPMASRSRNKRGLCVWLGGHNGTGNRPGTHPLREQLYKGLGIEQFQRVAQPLELPTSNPLNLQRTPDFLYPFSPGLRQRKDVPPMRLAEEIQKFSSACEHLLATTANSERTLTKEEGLLVEFYCNELLTKIVPPSIHPK